jgi:hypothetical protein
MDRTYLINTTVFIDSELKRSTVKMASVLLLKQVVEEVERTVARSHTELQEAKKLLADEQAAHTTTKKALKEAKDELMAAKEALRVAQRAVDREAARLAESHAPPAPAPPVAPSPTPSRVPTDAPSEPLWQLLELLERIPHRAPSTPRPASTHPSTLSVSDLNDVLSECAMQ